MGRHRLVRVRNDVVSVASNIRGTPYNGTPGVVFITDAPGTDAERPTFDQPPIGRDPTATALPTRRRDAAMYIADAPNQHPRQQARDVRDTTLRARMHAHASTCVVTVLWTCSVDSGIWTLFADIFFRSLWPYLRIRKRRFELSPLS